eukprot:scaffold7876_cov70-Skeletonema_dohrnii-CCMP3373.AAC.4
MPTSYTNQHRPPPDMDFEDPNQFNHSITQLIDAINNKQIGSLTIVNPVGAMVSLYNPEVMFDDHDRPESIYGNMTDNIHQPSPGMVRIEELGYTASTSSTKPHTAFSSGNVVAYAHRKTGAFKTAGTTYIALTPNFIALPRGVPPTQGMITDDDVLAHWEKLGTIPHFMAKALHNASTLFNDTKEIVDSILDKNEENNQIHPSFTDRQIKVISPTVTVNPMSKFPEEATDLRTQFLRPPTPPDTSATQQIGGGLGAVI